MSNGAANLLRVARPAFTVDGQDQPNLSGGLLGMVITETTEGLYRCEARFGNWGTTANAIGFLYFGRDMLDFGKPFVVKLGVDRLFDGRITALEALFPEGRPPEIVVLAEDRFQDLRMTRRTRTFEDVGDSDVFQQIANDHGLSPSVDLDGPTYRMLAQVNQSDLAFLRDRARAIDAELWMDGSTLNAKRRTSRNGATINLNMGANLRSFGVLADLAHQRTAVAANGWDVAGKAALQHEATESVISSELGGDSGGASILEGAFGARKESLAHAVPLGSDEAQTLAEAHFRRMARRFVIGRGVAEADAQLRVGATVELRGLGPLFSGRYYLAEVQHLFDGARGIRTEFSAERPGLGRP